MAGDWIKMRTNLDTDPAVVRIATGRKLDRFAVVGRLHKIWAWANEHLTDGQNVPIDSEFLDLLVECPGFSESLRSVGWLSGRDGSLCFPSFERHNGASAKARALDASRKKHVRSASEKCPDDNRTKLGPEKRRVEKSNKEIEKKGGWKKPDDIEQSIWDEWMSIRKKKKATNSDRAWSFIVKEAKKAGWSIAKVVERCVDKDWKGFEASWIQDADEQEPQACKPPDFNSPKWKERNARAEAAS